MSALPLNEALSMNETEQMNTIDSVEDVKAVVVDTLGLTGEAAVLSEDTALLGGIPEFDSLAVVELVAALESRLGIEMDDDDVAADVFATIGSLARLVDEKRLQ
jgi:acyl carrier protein